MNNINYNNELILTYKMFKKEDDSNLCYQIQLLQAFNMLKYDDYILQKNIESVYKLLKNDNNINKILLIISEKMKSYELFNLINQNEKNIFLFQLFFSYNYFEELKTFLSNNDL